MHIELIFQKIQTMKDVNLPQTKSNTELIVQNEKSVTLEPISLVELAEVLGGKNETTDRPHQLEQDSGHAGGIICWC